MRHLKRLLRKIKTAYFEWRLRKVYKQDEYVYEDE